MSNASKTGIKNFIIDTNVLLHDPDCIFKFEEHNVIIPMVVLEELDHFKSEKSEIGANARHVAHTLDRLREKSYLGDGVDINGAGRLMVWAKPVPPIQSLDMDKNDNTILDIAAYHSEQYGETFLVTKDVNLRVKADALGIPAEDYRADATDVSGVGDIEEVFVDESLIDEVYKSKSVKHELAVDGRCYVLKAYMAYGSPKSALVRSIDGELRVISPKCVVSGIKPRNHEQRFLAEMLLDDSLDMVVCAGVAGSGKTLLSIAAAIAGVECGKFDKVIITKSIQPVGADIGFVKGSKKEKMAEWVKPFYDNLEFVYHTMKKKGKSIPAFGGGSNAPIGAEDPFEDIIEIEAITYLRGRSLMNRYVIIDEVQNLTPKIMKTIVSRVADSAKLIVLGDLQQIDNPYLDAKNNGLAYIMARAKGERNIGVLNLRKSERGRLASFAIDKL